MIWLLACTSTPLPPCELDLEGPLIVAASAPEGYSTGALSVAAVDGSAVCDVATLHGDAVVDVVAGTVYAINRKGSDTVRRYDRLELAPTWEISTGELSNPQTVVGTDERLVITRLREPRLLVVDAADGSTVDTVDLGPWADADGIPEAGGAVLDGERALVAVQRNDRDHGWQADPTGYVVGIDLQTAEVAFDTPVGPDPVLAAHPDGGVVAATEDGAWWRVHADGRAEDPVTPDVGGVTTALAFAADGGAVAIVRTDADEYAVVCRDAWDGAVTGRTAPLAAYLTDVVVDEPAGAIWIAARRSFVDPKGAPGGYLTLPLDACGPLPEPDTWLRGLFPPYDLAVRR